MGAPMTDKQEAKKREWLVEIANHPETTDVDYAAAEAILRDAYLLTEQADVSKLVQLGFVVVNADGMHTAGCGCRGR